MAVDAASNAESRSDESDEELEIVDKGKGKEQEVEVEKDAVVPALSVAPPSAEVIDDPMDVEDLPMKTNSINLIMEKLAKLDFATCASVCGEKGFPVVAYKDAKGAKYIAVLVSFPGHQEFFGVDMVSL